MRLMVVEDNRTNLMVLKAILEKLEGCKVEGFGDPLVAYETATMTNFDLVLVDFMMPGMTFCMPILAVETIPQRILRSGIWLSSDAALFSGELQSEKRVPTSPPDALLRSRQRE